MTYLVVDGVGAGILHIECDESADVSSQPDVTVVSCTDYVLARRRVSG